MKKWISDHRVVVGVVAMVLVVLAGGGAVGLAALRKDDQAAGAAPPAKGGLLFVDLDDGQDRIQQVNAERPDGDRRPTSLRCQRVYQAAGTTICLRLAGIGPSYEVAVLDKSGEVVRTVGLPGIPSRARVSASGSVLSWTSFVTGDSYSVPGGFSTRTGVLDLRSGELTESLEHFKATIGGQVLAADDVNYWGVTVAADDRTFYATVASAGRTWLVKGDLVTKEVRDIRQTAECPSLSPDGTKVAYKKRESRLGLWKLAVTDLATGDERIIDGTTGIDDQAAWLDDRTLVYAAAPQDAPKPSIFRVPADGSASPTKIIANASSPVPVS